MSIEKLVEALERNDIGAAQVLLDQGVDPNCGCLVGRLVLPNTPRDAGQTDQGRSFVDLVETPLCVAIKKRNLVAVKLLLDCGAKANYQCQIENNYGDHPLSLASMAGNLDILKTLVEYEADVLQENEPGGSIALHTAARHSEEAALYLIDSCTTEIQLRQLYARDRLEKRLLDLYGDDFYIRGPYGEINTSDMNDQLGKRLLDIYGDDFYIRAPDGKNTSGMRVRKVRENTGELEKIFEAAGTGRLEALKQYTREYNNDKGVRRVNQRNQIGDTPMHDAIRTGQFATFEFLLVKKKADRLMRNDREWIALHMAARWNREDIAQCLLSNTDLKMFGKQMLARNAKGQIPAELCADFDHINLLNYFNRLVFDQFASFTFNDYGMNITIYWACRPVRQHNALSKLVVEMIPQHVDSHGQDGDDSRANRLAETLRGVLADYVEKIDRDSDREILENVDAHGQYDVDCRLFDTRVDMMEKMLLDIVIQLVLQYAGITIDRMWAHCVELKMLMECIMDIAEHHRDSQRFIVNSTRSIIVYNK